MFSKNSNKNLWIVLVILIIAVVLIFSSESTKNERSFKKDLVDIDTAAVTEILLYPKSQHGKEVKLVKDNDEWKVDADSGKQYLVPHSKVENLFNQLLRIKPERVAARSKDKWKEYKIDSTSTRVQVKEDGDKVLDLMIGKFSYQQPRSMSTYVKLADDNDIYEVDGFLDITFNKGVNSFRDETIVRSDKSKWNKLTFDADKLNDSFELVNVDNHWQINGNKTDSIKTEKALNTLSRLTNNSYINLGKDKFPRQTAKLTIEVNGGDPITITAYQDSTNYIIESSQNPDNYFDGKKVGDKIFLKKESLF